MWCSSREKATSRVFCYRSLLICTIFCFQVIADSIIVVWLRMKRKNISGFQLEKQLHFRSGGARQTRSVKSLLKRPRSEGVLQGQWLKCQVGLRRSLVLVLPTDYWYLWWHDQATTIYTIMSPRVPKCWVLRVENLATKDFIVLSNVPYSLEMEENVVKSNPRNGKKTVSESEKKPTAKVNG